MMGLEDSDSSSTSLEAGSQEKSTSLEVGSQEKKEDYSGD
jgi:hypothetical protein